MGAHAFFVLGTVPIMSKPAPLDPAQFSLSRHGHPVQNGGIFFVSMSLGAAMIVVSAIQFLDVTKTESGTSVDREIYWVTYLLGKCLGRCSTFFPSEIEHFSV